MKLRSAFRRTLKKFVAAVVIITLLILSIDKFGGYVLKKLYPLKYGVYVERYCEEYNVDKYFGYAFIKCESNFQKDAESSAGAMGLMQLTSDTFGWISEKLTGETLSEERITEPELNIRFGIWYISYLYEKFGDKSLTVAAYNAGPANVTEWLANPEYSSDGKTISVYPFKETESHVKKVLRAESIYKKLYETKKGDAF